MEKHRMVYKLTVPMSKIEADQLRALAAQDSRSMAAMVRKLIADQDEREMMARNAR
jgi:hypothetical protein